MEKPNDIKIQIETLPEKPGVYQFYNTREELIYVGKAKNLKKRVSSYFSKNHNSTKTSVLVKQIWSLKYILVDSEEDALLLENNLIKKFQPRYNVLLKDGKTYPSICITNEEFPRIFKTRNIIKNGSKYFGPYSSNYTINSLIEIIHDLYPIRTCRFPVNKQTIKDKKFKVCLQFHIHKCNGVCEGKENAETYRSYIEEITEIIKGNASEISKMLFEQMKQLANNYRFEEAQKIKEKYELIESYRSKSIVSNTVLENTDVFGYEQNDGNAYINILRISRGSIIQGYTIEYKKKLDEQKEEILAMAVVELRERMNSDSKEIVLPFEIDVELNNIDIIIPQRGDRKKLLDLAQQNVRQYKLEKLKQTEKLNPEQRNTQLLRIIQEKLRLSKMPITIDCFDNSNIQGSDPVAGCIVYKYGKPSKQDYRKYNIKTVVGPDDYGSMREVVKRRYQRMIEEGTPLPDLIVVDGGSGQMEVVRQVIEKELNLSIQIAGMAKDNKHKSKELLIGFPPQIIGLKPTEQIFKFFAGMQEEVHRFAITFHRDKRSKNQISSELDKIKGIGEKTKKTLIFHFKSIKRIQNADKIEIEKIIGSSRASIIYNYFQSKKTL